MINGVIFDEELFRREFKWDVFLKAIIVLVRGLIDDEDTSAVGSMRYYFVIQVGSKYRIDLKLFVFASCHIFVENLQPLLGRESVNNETPSKSGWKSIFKIMVVSTSSPTIKRYFNSDISYVLHFFEFATETN